ncbi:MarR family winged helix-turn-helix transcriptional regulator [Lactococcus termiticola]|uniref:MarR family transcriptional regulator n=1 Tax=Lactococcus termiticola TaxID=2169526 RepID=A0A2R5HDF6_9LACT|nr:winged helix-turn-helix transcriptional regulator [Lactococcus termiticola]GBG96114.1 MarR family transcriptional regulator [Lactococcus termiticola]
MITEENRGLASMLRQFQFSGKNNEQEWILKHLAPEMRPVAKGLSILGYHILSSLTTGDMTGRELSEVLDATRGGVSRAAQALLESEMIASYQLAEDKKKIYYRLTDQGWKLAAVHDAMHEVADAYQKRELFDHYTEKEKALVLRFLEDVKRVQNTVLKEEEF